MVQHFIARGYQSEPVYYAENNILKFQIAACIFYIGYRNTAKRKKL